MMHETQLIPVVFLHYTDPTKEARSIEARTPADALAHARTILVREKGLRVTVANCALDKYTMGLWEDSIEEILLRETR